MNVNTLFLNIKHKFQSGIGKDVLWTLLGQIMIMLGLLIINKVLSNYLSMESFGKFNIIKRSSSVISFIMLAGTGVAIPRFLPIYREQKRYFSSKCFLVSVSFYFLFISFIVIVLSLIFYNQICSIVLGDNDISFYYIVIGYSFILACASFLFAYYRGRNQFKDFNISQIVFQYLLLVPLLIIRWIGLKELILIWCIIGLVFLAFSFHKELKSNRFIFFKRIRKEQTEGEIRKLSKYSIPRLVSDFFLFSISAFPLLYIGSQSTLRDVSLYSVGITIVTLVSPIFSFLGVILLPYVSTCFAQNNLKEASRMVNKLSIIYVTLAILASVFFYVLMPWLIKLFFAEKYIEALNIARLVTISILPQALYLLYRNPIDAISVKPYNLGILGISFAVLVVSFYFSNTLEQYALSYVLSSSVQGILSLIIWMMINNKNK